MKIFFQKICFSEKLVLLAFTFAGVFFVHSVYANPLVVAERSETDRKIEGINLRQNLFDTVKKNVHQSPDAVNKEIESVLLRSIPIGTSFDDAEDILRAAGFRVYARGLSHPRKIGEYEGQMGASLDSVYVSGKIFKTSESLHVWFYPKDPDKFDQVYKIKAYIDMPMF